MLPFVYNFPFFCIVAIMLTGAICPALKNGKVAFWLSFTVSALSAVLSGILLYFLYTGNITYTYVLGHFPAPWGNELKAGPLQALLSTVFATVMCLALLGGKKDLFRDVLPEKQKLYFIMTNLTLASLFALTYTNDVFTAYVFIEISTLAACSLVMAKDTGHNLVATIRYLFMSLLGSGLFLIGVILLYCITGQLLMIPLQEEILAIFGEGIYRVPLAVIIGLMAVGLSIKAALFPFHRWLPAAHGGATTASSSILSGLVVKCYIVLMITLFYRVFTTEVIRELKINNVIFVFGLSSMIVGSVYAIKEDHIKRMLAYSSVAQLGYIFMGIGLGTDIGVTAAVYQLIVHAFTKPMLFSCAGRLASTVGHHKNFKNLKGTAYNDKLAGVCFTVGALSMIGIPLFGGFVSKMYLASASLLNPKKMILSLSILAVSTVLNALYYIPAVSDIWSKLKDGETVEPKHPGEAVDTAKDKTFMIAAVILAFMVIFLGICYQPIINIIQSGLQLMN